MALLLAGVHNLDMDVFLPNEMFVSHLLDMDSELA